MPSDGSARRYSVSATANAAIEIALSRHVIVLTALIESVPAQARDAIEHALAASTKFLDDLDGASLDRPGRALGADRIRVLIDNPDKAARLVLLASRSLSASPPALACR